MNYSEEIIEGIYVFTWRGDLIGQDVGPELLEKVSEKIDQDFSKCLIDLSDLRYMNSSGIGVLMTILTKFKAKGGKLVLLNPSPSVSKLLGITKLDSIFLIKRETQEAFALLKQD